MAAVESTSLTMRPTSFQRMLELEKKYKLERERLNSLKMPVQSSSPVQSPPAQSSVQPPLAAPRPPAMRLHNPTPIQALRPDFLDRQWQQEQDRSHIEYASVKERPEDGNPMLKTVPTLSVTIPQGDSGESRGSSKESRGPKTDTEEVTPAQKQVKFLSPDDDDRSDTASSICQSPSWEGYGQKKREKKEAERRKKEQAEREAKNGKKRTSARLSKPPPPSHLRSVSSVSGSTEAHHVAPGAEPESKQLLPDPKSKPEKEREGILKHATQLQTASPGLARPSHPSNNHETDTRPSTLKPHAADSGSAAAAANPRENRGTREICPPSASRTPLLRHFALSSHSSSNLNILQGAAGKAGTGAGREGKSSTGPSLPPGRSNMSQDSLYDSAGSERGRQMDGYVRHQRDQSTERALAGLVNAQLGMAPSTSSSERNSSRTPRNSRRSSLTQEAKSIAMRIAGILPSSERKFEKGRARSGSVEYLATRGANPSVEETASSSTVNSTKKGRSFKDAAKAALSISKSSPSPSPSVPPPADGPIPKPATDTTLSQPSNSSLAKPVLLEIPSDRHVSEISSSSSACEDVSLLLSPATTPDTSRPQSSKGSSSSAADDNHDNVAQRQRTAAPQGGVTSPRPPTELAKKPETTSRQTGKVGEMNKGMASTTKKTLIPIATEIRVQPPAEPRPNSVTLTSLNYDDVLKDTPLIPKPLNAKKARSNSREISRQGTNEERKAEKRPRSKHNNSRTNFLSDLDLPTGAFEIDLEPSLLPVSESETAAPIRTRRREHDTHGVKSLSTAAEFPQAESRFELRGKQDDKKAKPEPELENPSLSVDNLPRGGPARVQQKKEVTPEPRGTGQKEVVEQSARAGAGVGGDDGEDGEDGGAFWHDLRNYDPNSSKSHISLWSTGNFAPPKHHSASNSMGSVRSGGPPVVLTPVQGTADATGASAPKIGTSSTASSRTSVSQSAISQLPSQTTARVMIPLVAKSKTDPAASAATTTAIIPGPLKARPISAMPPVSILKPNSLSPSPPPILSPPASSSSSSSPSSSSSSTSAILSALPKHMQLQTGGMPGRQQPLALSEMRTAPVAKMFVECCNCRFYHDMPSRVYECMARPDAVVEDRERGISGAITTAVKCPWCQHDMSTKCCAGYAAVVYLKERLH